MLRNTLKMGFSNTYLKWSAQHLRDLHQFKGNIHQLYSYLLNNPRNAAVKSKDDLGSLIIFIGLNNLRSHNIDASRFKYKMIYNKKQQNFICLFMQILKELVLLCMNYFRPTLDLAKNIEIFIALANLQIRDNQLIEQISQEYIRKVQKFDLETILTFYWSLHKVKAQAQQFIQDAFQVQRRNQKKRSYLQYLWNLSNELYIYDPLIIQHEIKEMLPFFLVEWDKYQNHNQKSGYQMLQLMSNLYPEDLNNQFEPFIKLAPYKCQLQALQYKSQKIKDTIKDIQQQNLTLTYIEKNVKDSNEKQDPWVNKHIFSFKTNKSLNVSENQQYKNIKHILDEMKIQYQQNFNVGIYDIDWYIQEKNVLVDLSGKSTYITEVNQKVFTSQTSMNQDIKKRQLEMMGYKKYLLLNQQQWLKKQKENLITQVQYLHFQLNQFF